MSLPSYLLLEFTTSVMLDHSYIPAIVIIQYLPKWISLQGAISAALEIPAPMEAVATQYDTPTIPNSSEDCHTYTLQIGQCGLSSAICHGTATTTCISNCNATAMCGIYSKNGMQKCGLSTCCSAAGFCGVWMNLHSPLDAILIKLADHQSLLY